MNGNLDLCIVLFCVGAVAIILSVIFRIIGNEIKRLKWLPVKAVMLREKFGVKDTNPVMEYRIGPTQYKVSVKPDFRLMLCKKDGYYNLLCDRYSPGKYIPDTFLNNIPSLIMMTAGVILMVIAAVLAVIK